MVLGLGTGTTAQHLLEALAERIAKGLLIRGVASSARTEASARSLGIPLTTLEESPALDVCIDGADEVDARLDCLKGLGGAFVREKIVAATARRFVLIVDDSKLVSKLGERSPVLVEVVAFGLSAVRHALADLSPRPRLKDGRPFISDNGNPVLELHAGVLADPPALARRLEATPGVVDHGLFLGMAGSAYVAAESGVRRIDRPPA